MSRRVSEVTRGLITSTPNLPNPKISNHSEQAGNAHVTLLVFHCVGGTDCLPSDDPTDRLPAYLIKNIRK